MGRLNRPRHGSLQFWPRKRAIKEIPSVNWLGLEQRASAKNHLLGFIGYKAGMKSVLVKDKTNNSMTKGKNIVLPVTLIECPPMKVLAIRYYKNKLAVGEISTNPSEKELKRKITLPKNVKQNAITDFDDVRIIAYTLVSKTSIKKTPDISEIGITGSNAQEKEAFAKGLVGKEINFEEFFDKNQLVDVHGVTKGKGFQGAVKRYGITFRPHKSEKGVRKVGSIGPWHPAKVSYRVPMAGQLGFFTRIKYNNTIINTGKSFEEPLQHYGKINNSYCMIKGSVSGPAKRAVIITPSFRPTKVTLKENFEFMETLK